MDRSSLTHPSRDARLGLLQLLIKEGETYNAAHLEGYAPEVPTETAQLPYPQKASQGLNEVLGGGRQDQHLLEHVARNILYFGSGTLFL